MGFGLMLIVLIECLQQIHPGDCFVCFLDLPQVTLLIPFPHYHHGGLTKSCKLFDNFKGLNYFVDRIIGQIITKKGCICSGYDKNCNAWLLILSSCCHSGLLPKILRLLVTFTWAWSFSKFTSLEWTLVNELSTKTLNPVTTSLRCLYVKSELLSNFLIVAFEKIFRLACSIKSQHFLHFL